MLLFIRERFSIAWHGSHLCLKKLGRMSGGEKRLLSYKFESGIWNNVIHEICLSQFLAYKTCLLCKEISQLLIYLRTTIAFSHIIGGVSSEEDINLFSMEDDKEIKQASKSLPVTQLDEQIDSDFALAMALQEQERTEAFTMLPTFIPSESSNGDEDDDDESLFSYDDEDYEFFDSREVITELEFLDRESSSNTDMELEEEDDIDPDEMSYEELMALGEVVGKENIGLSQDQISACLHPWKFQSLIECKNGIDRCVICQVEYEGGQEEEELAALVCEHPYHFECISKWLQIKKTCPICSIEVSPPPKIAS